MLQRDKTLAQEPAPTRDGARLERELCEALLTPRSPEEMARLLRDLCTPAEISSIAERWHVARLLDGTDLSYRDIHDGTGVSTTTIVRVARFLRQEPHQGYRAALERLRSGRSPLPRQTRPPKDDAMGNSDVR
jgi:TrpR-related protein YerC/YecD